MFCSYRVDCSFVHGAGTGVSASEPPRRGVSLTLCADQLLVAWASDGTVSAEPRRLKEFTVVNANAEVVLPLKPDLIISDERAVDKAAVEGAMQRMDVLQFAQRLIVAITGGERARGRKRRPLAVWLPMNEPQVSIRLIPRICLRNLHDWPLKGVL